jgi:hypothetical protein
MEDIPVLMSKREKMENVFLGNRKLQQKKQLYLLRRIYTYCTRDQIWLIFGEKIT